MILKGQSHNQHQKSLASALSGNELLDREGGVVRNKEKPFLKLFILINTCSVVQLGFRPSSPIFNSAMPLSSLASVSDE